MPVNMQSRSRFTINKRDHVIDAVNSASTDLNGLCFSLLVIVRLEVDLGIVSSGQSHKRSR
jgi:hypothetical protein